MAVSFASFHFRPGLSISLHRVVHRFHPFSPTVFGDRDLTSLLEKSPFSVQFVEMGVSKNSGTPKSSILITKASSSELS